MGTKKNGICPPRHLRFTLEPKEVIRLPRMYKGSPFGGSAKGARRELTGKRIPRYP